MTSSSWKALEFDKLLSTLAATGSTDESRERLASLTPSSDLEYLRLELLRVEELRRFLQRNGSLPGGAPDIRLFLKRASLAGSALEEIELLAILHHLRIHASTRKMLAREAVKMPLTVQLLSPLEPLPALEAALDQAITPDATLRDSASPELARLRRSISVQMEHMRAKIAALIPKLSRQGVLREDSFSVRDGRYVLPVRSDAMGSIKGIVHDRSATGGTLFVEPTALIDIGNELRALELAERDEARRILKELTSFVRRDLSQIETNERALVSLDVIWSKARFSEVLDAYAPTLARSGPLRILGGRHPLLTLAGRDVVPLNIELGAEFDLLVISGPNAGGKSVAMKTVGLLTLMAACGLHIPALPGTEIPLYRTVEADIGDQQSIADDLSTFTAHAARLKEILASAGERTLVLIDEIGAGTDPQEGASLSIAALEQLLARRVPTIVTTHHSAMKAFAHSTDRCANGSMEFDVASFRPTYRFRPHIPGSSYALDIARRAGLPDDLIGRAKALLGGERSKLEDLIASLSEKLARYDSLVRDQQDKTSLVTAQEEDYHRKLERLKEREKQLKRQAMQEVEELLKQARRTVEATVREIREKSAVGDSIRNARQSLSDLKAAASAKLGVPTIDVPQPPSRDVHPESVPHKKPEPGDWVSVDGGAPPGQVTAMTAKGDRICVAMGSVQLWVATERVEVVEPPGAAEVKVSSYVKMPETPFELDLRGLDAAEALVRLDRYLYDGYNAGRTRLGVIHGKGAGILARHVQRHLKGHSLVETFRFGEYGEGDYGVTVVKLKE